MALSGGDKLRAMAVAAEKQTTGKPRTLRVGFLENATYPNGTPVAMIAAIQEYGAPRVGIPPRPFFRTMIAKHKDEWGKGIAGVLAANNYDVEKSLALLGQVIEGQLRQSIIDVLAPPLSPTTIMLRKMKSQNPALRTSMTYADVIEARRRVAAGYSMSGVSTKPLVDTGHMLNSVHSEVV
jgi:hypothetical protein